MQRLQACTPTPGGCHSINRLQASTVAELLHDEIGLKPQQKGLAGEGISRCRTLSQGFRLKDRRLTGGVLAVLQTAQGI